MDNYNFSFDDTIKQSKPRQILRHSSTLRNHETRRGFSRVSVRLVCRRVVDSSVVVVVVVVV